MMRFEDLMDRIKGKAPKGAKRSRTWPQTRKAHLLRHPCCAVCRSKSKIQVHHVIPFYIAPDQEEVEDNLVTLCQNKKYGINCHLLLGHAGRFSRINPSCRIDIAIWSLKLR